jgi:hypothetical protein
VQPLPDVRVCKWYLTDNTPNSWLVSVLTLSRSSFEGLKALSPAERGQGRQYVPAPGIADDAFYTVIPGETFTALLVRKGEQAFEVQIIEPTGTTMSVNDKKAREKTLAIAALGRL